MAYPLFSIHAVCAPGVIPEGAILGYETLVMKGLGKERSEMVKFGGHDYSAGAILDEVKKRRGSRGDTDAEFMQSLVSGSTRKSKNCCPRLLNIIASEPVRSRFVQSEQQASRTELDRGAVGAKKSIWLEIHELFVNPVIEVR